VIGTLSDRAAEAAALDEVLAAVRDGLSGVLVLRGEAGIGKTVLLEYAAERAGDMRVARVAGVESEMDLAFAGLHQLLVPFLDGIGRLPLRQRRALQTAFRLATGPVPDRFLVSLAALTLITNAALEHPVLCLIDDAQWLDRVSVTVLEFVARRLLADRVGMVFAVRTGLEHQTPVLEGLPELTVTELPDEAALQVLSAVTDGPVDTSVGKRVVAEAAGNPLAVVEFAAELTAEELAGTAPLPGPLRFGGRVEELYVSRILALPGDTQLLLLIAAADGLRDQEKIWRAARFLGIDPDIADVPAAGRLVSWRPRVEFRHPLMRSAAYYASPAMTRRRAHEALAAVTDPRLDPDRRAWHLAAAAIGPDERVAAGLEESAGRARARGGWASSAIFLERAAELTPDAGRRAHRLLAAAEARLDAGEPAAAGALAERAAPELADPLARAKNRRIEGLTLYAAGRAHEAVPVLVDAAAMLATSDARLARDTLLDAYATAQRFGGVSVVTPGLLRAIPPPPDAEVTVADLLLDGFAAVTEHSYDSGAALLRLALARLTGDQRVPDEALQHFLAITNAANLLFDDSARHQIERRWTAELRARGALAALLVALIVQVTVGIQEGRFADAAATIAEGRSLSEATGWRVYLPVFAHAEVLAMAWQGREADARPLAARMLAELDWGHGHAVRRHIHHALTILELSLGNYAEALDHAARSEAGERALGAAPVADMVEAAVRSGEWKTAAAAVDTFEPWALASGTHWALGLLARSRALLAADDCAESEYLLAIEHLRQCRIVPDLARSRLLYGEWLRRQRRRRDARGQLRIAHGMFSQLGMDGFARRARAELRATGGQAARSAPGAPESGLTPQETQVARLAGEGATNGEIAARLFISAATVEYHLRGVFRKMNITSRVQLARALTPDVGAAPPENVTLLRSCRWRRKCIEVLVILVGFMSCSGGGKSWRMCPWSGSRPP
jgi:DNA-binding CsgD family transcriptional regulator